MEVFKREQLSIGMLLLDPTELSDTDSQQRAVALWELGFLDKYVVTDMRRLKSTALPAVTYEEIKTYYVTRLEMRGFMDEKGIDWFISEEQKLEFTVWIIDNKVKGRVNAD